METEDDPLLSAVPGWKLTGLFPRRESFDNPGTVPPEGLSRRFDIAPEDEDDDAFPLPNPVPPPPPQCPVSGSVKVVLADIVSCGCVMGDTVTAFSGLNGSHTLLWSAGEFQLDGFGSFTIERRENADCTGALLHTYTGAFFALAQCSAGQWRVAVFLSSPDFTDVIFDTAPNPQPYGVPASNVFTCDGTFYLAGGTSVVTRS